MSSAKGAATRAHIYRTALKIFRRRGVSRVSMRDIAKAADMSLGAAYHYFPSKDAIFSAYFENSQVEHEALATWSEDAELRERVRVILQSKLDLLRKDRKILAALFVSLGDPQGSLSLFGKSTRALRERSIAQFRAVFDDEALDDDVRAWLGTALWLLHLAVFLHLVHDRSRGQARTQAIVDLLVDVVPSVVPWLSAPLVVERVRAFAHELEAA